MPDFIRLTPLKYNAIGLEYRRGENLLYSDRSSFLKDADIRRIANRCGVSVAVLYGILDAFRRQEFPQRADYEVPTNETPPVVLRFRSIRSPDFTEFRCIDDVLAHTPDVPEPRIEWDDIEQVCAVDLDNPRMPIDLDALLVEVQPKPTHAWVTKSGGLRLLYVAVPPYTAEELASVACLTLTDRYPLATIELKKDTRHPAYVVEGKPCGPVVRCEGGVNLASLGRFLGTASVSEPEIAEWLSARGLDIGKRYPHSRCPVNPDGRDNNPSVQVYATHVFCFHCQKDGKRLRGRSAGYFPYTALLGTYVPSQFVLCVRSLTHWTHAKAIVEPIAGKRSRALYSAALKQAHGKDPRVPLVFTTGTNLVRYPGYWATAAGEPLNPGRPGFFNIVKRLPALLYPEDDTLKVNEETLGIFGQSVDLSRYGYPAITTLWGCKIWGEHLENPENRITLVQHKIQREDRRPRFVRGEEETAWETIERYFPGINRNLIKLLLCAKGCMEGQSGLPPMLFITGPTGAGKTVSVNLAAGIAGDGVKCVTWSTSPDRIRQHLLEAKEQGSFATFDEFVKQSETRDGVNVKAMEMLLNFTADSLSHKLYVGSVPLGTPPVCVWCDTVIPPEIATHGQIARRLVAVHLPTSHREWETRGLPCPPVDIRTVSAELADACDVILSAVIDEFFSAPIVFRDCAERLGFRTMEHGDKLKETEDEVRELYSLYLAAKKDDKGFVAVPPDEANRMRAIYQSVTLRRIQEMDLGALLGTGVTTFSTRGNQRNLYVKFTVELQPGTSSVCGPGDTERTEPESGGFPSLSHLPNYKID